MTCKSAYFSSLPSLTSREVPVGVLLLPSLMLKWMSFELPLKLCKESTLSEQSMLLVPEEVTSVSADKSRLLGNAMLKDA